jgi:hypothetical protein
LTEEDLDDLREIVRRTRAAQGLGPKITDQAVLGRLAELLATDDTVPAGVV